MKKLFLVLVATLICGACMLTSCKKEDNLNVSEKIIGKWMAASVDGQAMPTNEKKVYTFISTSQAYVSASLNSRPDVPAVWNKQKEVAVAISGNIVTLTNHTDEHTTVVEEYTVTAINDSEFTANIKLTATVDGTAVKNEEHTMRYVKVTADYSEAILGLWECQSITGGETNNDDNARLEFLADGSYNFYRKSETGFWALVPRELNEYFVDGNMLCTRWQAAGEEMSYEWWEIASVEVGQMQWTALRKNADGTTTFQQGVNWLKATPRIVLAAMDASNVILYDNVAYTFTYDADFRLTNIYEVTNGDNYVACDLDFVYSPGHITLSGFAEGSDIIEECTLDAQGRIIEWNHTNIPQSNNDTISSTTTYTYYPDGHLQSRTEVSDGGSPLTTTYFWENGELVRCITGDNTIVVEMVPSDAPAQSNFSYFGYPQYLDELCPDGVFGVAPLHMPATRTLTAYLNGIPVYSNTFNYTYTVDAGRLATMQEEGGPSYTFHWGIMK